ncbi:hypothetical protein ACQ9LF_13885 [Anaerohalosphaeraceae bacterium U12dextr]
MITEETVIQWMRRRIADGQVNSAADLAGEFLEMHHIRDVHSQDFASVINAGFKLAPEIANTRKI